jgi:hypothetical protein
MQSKPNKQMLIATFFVTLLLFQVVSVAALTASQARDNWLDAKEESLEAQSRHRNTKTTYGQNTPEALETGKESMHAALNEAEAWLIWKEAQANENSEIPDNLREDILADIENNKGKIKSLKAEVDAVNSQIELAATFLKMIGKYTELLTDVARNSGKIWVFVANERIKDLESYQIKLKEFAEDRDNGPALVKLNDASEKIEEAKSNIDNAEEYYNRVQIRTNPVINFHEGNKRLRFARMDMLEAHIRLNEALGELLGQ